MGGGLMQIVAYGAQDLYLTGGAAITFFKAVYKRHTNFATESLEQTFSGTGDFGRKVKCELQRAGDLVTKMYLRAVLPALPKLAATGSKVAWTPKVGHALINTAELDIGGVKVDKHYGDWLNIWYEFARNFAHDRGYDRMIGNTPQLTTLSESQPSATLWVPLCFSCCRNDGLALPLIALQYHDITISIEFNPLSKLLCRTVNYDMPTGSNAQLQNASLFVDYVYLENDERKRFATANHEYLFEQLQFTGDESVTNKNAKYRLNLNHPCKALFWAARHQNFTTGVQYLAYNPNNQELARVEATKRFVLKCAGYSLASTIKAPSNKVAINSVIGSTTTEGKLFTEIDAVALSTAADIDNITILGRLLTVSEFSKPVSSWSFGTGGDTMAAVSPSAGDGSASLDVVVYTWCNYGVNLDGSGNPTEQALLQLNGHDRFTKREGLYFNQVQAYQCFSNTPAEGVNVYSFALKPEEHQPSGTCNMSRIDNATLNIDFDSTFMTNVSGSTIAIYAINYNVLRVMSGMGGLAYSN